MRAPKSISISRGEWEPYPLDAAQVIEGDPAPVVRWLHVSGEGEPGYYAGVWRAERSTFRWTFDFNETAHILSGRIRVTDESGSTHDYAAGDVVYFPKGARTTWEIVERFEKVFVDSA